MPERDRMTVLFDLDGVLLRCDAFTVLIRHALTRRPWRLFPAAALLTTSLALPAAGLGRFRVNRALVRLALRGIDETRYDALAVRIGTELAQSGFRNDSLIEEACRYREAGSRVIVVTATERRLARSYLDAVGLGGVELVASELTFPNNRRASLATYNIGPQKVSSLVELGVDLAGCLFYTDSATDLPLMKRVAECILVAPNRATQRAVRLATPPIPFTVRRPRQPHPDGRTSWRFSAQGHERSSKKP